MPVRICFYGTYDDEATRTRVLWRGLQAAGAQVTACHVRMWPTTQGRVAAARSLRAGLALAWCWLRAQARLLKAYRRAGHYDVLLVPYPGYADMLLARLLAWRRRAPLVLDAFISLYETVVEDRALCGPRSPLAWALWAVDWLALHLADRALADTAANADFYAARYCVARARLIVVPVGADEEVWGQAPKPPPVGARHAMPLRGCTTEGAEPAGEPETSHGLDVLYFGQFIPLHGVEHILEAAAELRREPEIHFELIGDGQAYAAARAQAERMGLANVTFGPRWLDPPALAKRIAAADVCLGVFGSSAKAARVIPIKAYVALALGAPLVTMDSPGAREALVHGTSAYLCAPASGVALAQALRALHDPALRSRLAEGGRALSTQRFTAGRIGAALLGELLRLR